MSPRALGLRATLESSAAAADDRATECSDTDRERSACVSSVSLRGLLLLQLGREEENGWKRDVLVIFIVVTL